MAKGRNQKAKLLYLEQLFKRETDEQHGITMQQILSYLGDRDVAAERKTIYDDIEVLQSVGLDIIHEKRGKEWVYYLASNEFELSEVKLLVDSVQIARFLTTRQSDALIAKLEGLLSKYEGKNLQKQVITRGRVKTPNKSVYYNIDAINDAICDGVKIKFKYFKWNLSKEHEAKKSGDYYIVSPFSLLWDDEKYYLLAYESESDIVKHYRVDKMANIVITGEAREGMEKYRKLDLSNYQNSIFGMFGGEEEKVKFEVKNDAVGIFIDRFGKDIPIIRKDNESFYTYANVTLSSHFFGWMFAIGADAKIVAPKSAVKKMKDSLSRLSKEYSKIK